jgi:two-component system chemotaxis response regulator CheY
MPSAATLKTLVVDDQQTMRMLVRSGLQQLGFRELHDAVDGEAALQIAAQTPPNLVISDFNMPKLDGLVFFEQSVLIRQPRGPHLSC